MVSYNNTSSWRDLIVFPSESVVTDASPTTPWVARTSGYCRNNMHVAVFIAVAYVVTIFGLQHYMKNREPIKMDGLQAAWNFGLGLFSLVGAWVVVPLVYAEYLAGGVDGSVCTCRVELQSVWVYYFCMSKVPELLDTIFIVLRKSRLRLLQWYHHVVTMLYCWHSWAMLISNGSLFAVMNLIVHSIMYPYFGFTTLGVKFPQAVRVVITSLQLVQMVFGVWFTIRAIQVCPDEAVMSNQIVSLVMYFSYFVLFAVLFYTSYVSPAPAKPTAASKDRKKKQ